MILKGPAEQQLAMPEESALCAIPQNIARMFYIDIVLAVYILLAAVLWGLNIYMYFSSDSLFAFDYRWYRWMVATCLPGFAILCFQKPKRKLMIIATIAVLAASNAFQKAAFMGSLDKFLYLKNRVLYQGAVQHILHRHRGEDKTETYEENPGKRLPYTVVVREKDYVVIYFYIQGTALRSRLVYTDNIKRLRDEEGKFEWRHARFEAVEGNWYTVVYGD